MRVEDSRLRSQSNRVFAELGEANAVAMIARVRSSGFLNGAKGFKAYFGWFLKPESRAALTDGRYDDWANTSSGETDLKLLHLPVFDGPKANA